MTVPEHRTENDWLRLSEDALDVAEMLPFLHTPEAGGIDLFVGTTRRWTDGDETMVLTYDAYAPMAMTEMKRLLSKARDRWSVVRIALWHRVGDVPVGEASVVVGVASAHRAEAFATCRFLIDTLKEEVPIWKKEHARDGAQRWVAWCPGK